MRSQHTYADMLFEWTDTNPAGLWNEGLIWFAPAIHFTALTIIALACFTLFFQNFSIPTYIGVFGIPPSFLYIAILVMSTFIIAFLWGFALAVNPFYKPFPRQAHFALSEEGILYAGRLFGWNIFTHYTINETNRIIRLWSATAPGHVLFTFLPVDSRERLELEYHLSRYLPTSVPLLTHYSWTGWALPVTMLAASIGVICLTLGLFLNTGIIGLLATAILMIVFTRLGGWMIVQFGFGSKDRPAKLLEDENTSKK